MMLHDHVYELVFELLNKSPEDPELTVLVKEKGIQLDRLDERCHLIKHDGQETGVMLLELNNSFILGCFAVNHFLHYNGTLYDGKIPMGIQSDDSEEIVLQKMQALRVRNATNSMIYDLDPEPFLLQLNLDNKCLVSFNIYTQVGFDMMNDFSRQ